MLKKEPVTLADLMTLLKQKDCKAFDIIYDQYSAALQAIVYRMIADKIVTEDLLQDIFVKIWRHLDNYDNTKGTLFTWMTKIARNVCIDHLRARHYNQQISVIETDYDYNGIVATALPPADTITISELHKVVQKLDVKQRVVIEMVYFRGFTHQEASEVLVVSLGTVKTRCRAGLKQIRDMYK